MKIDKTDKKILNILMENSRLSYREIAKKAGVSAVTALKRVKELEKENIIRSYDTRIDYEGLGYDVQVIIQMRIAKGKLFNVERKIAVDKHVFAVYDMTGAFDAMIIAKFKNRKSLDSFLKKIQGYDFVERTRTNLILHTITERRIKVE